MSTVCARGFTGRRAADSGSTSSQEHRYYKRRYEKQQNQQCVDLYQKNKGKCYRSVSNSETVLENSLQYDVYDVVKFFPGTSEKVEV